MNTAASTTFRTTRRSRLLLALATERLDCESPLTRGLLFAALALLGLAFVLAPRH